MRYTIPKCFLRKGGGGVLQLILGLSGTGKTGRVVTEMKVRAAAGLSSILLVPEQFSSSAETMVYKALGDRLSAYAEVYSFTSFAEYLLKTFGGVAVPTLTDAARAVAVRRAMDALGEEVKLYYKNGLLQPGRPGHPGAENRGRRARPSAGRRGRRRRRRRKTAGAGPHLRRL